jgi:hypothetical protein
MRTAFMPRPENMNPDLVGRCATAGISVIDPSSPDLVAQIELVDLLLTESLVGAQTADLLRVPWISIYADRGHEQYWYDWCESKGMIWSPIDMTVHTLAWARDFAVPQLSALGVSR